jgi:hypothetical protein
MARKKVFNKYWVTVTRTRVEYFELVVVAKSNYDALAKANRRLQRQGVAYGKLISEHVGYDTVNVVNVDEEVEGPIPVTESHRG